MVIENNVGGDPNSLIMVLDAGAFINGIGPQLPGIIVTSPLVIQEIRSPHAKEIIARLSAANRLRVVAPSSDIILEVQKLLHHTRDQFVVSPTDTEILALAYDYHKKSKKVLLITDDYAIQNIAKIMKLHYTGYGQKGIRKVWKWQIYCPSCFQKYSDARVGDSCITCGAKLKRRRIK